MDSQKPKDEEPFKVRLQVKAVPVREYLQDHVVPILLQGLQQLVVDRPANPVGYLGEFLIRNDPRRPQELPEDPRCAHCVRVVLRYIPPGPVEAVLIVKEPPNKQAKAAAS